MGKRATMPRLQDSARVPLAAIDSVISAELGPARVAGNAQPNVFFRQIAMYLAKHVGGWSTTQISRFYNGRDHSTVCYSIRRIEQARPQEPALDSLLSRLAAQCRQESSHPSHRATTWPIGCAALEGALVAEQIADRVLSQLRIRGARSGISEG
jgi:hypothetical protein